ncbi:MAG: hypothetical protein K0R58_3959 [Ramlibacter sp.]|nr:hypothetical protein [Ramlibacter sp.]
MDSTIEVQSAGESHSFSCAPGERLLDACLRVGLNVSYGCATGTCGDCRATVIRGEVESLWADAPGARALRQPGEVLLCQTSARGSCLIEAKANASVYPRGVPQGFEGLIERIVPNDDGLTWVELALDRPIRFLAGQFVLVSMPGVQGYRAYSPAHDGQNVSRLSLVVRNKTAGALSPLLCSLDSVSRRVNVFGPLGSAHVRPDEDRDIAVVAGGSGAAVALSVLDWAVASGHLERNRLNLVCGLRTRRPRAMATGSGSSWRCLTRTAAALCFKALAPFWNSSREWRTRSRNGAWKGSGRTALHSLPGRRLWSRARCAC